MARMRFSLLQIDLSKRKTTVLDVTEEVGSYVGGRGLGAKLLWDRVPPGADPLGPENILFFGVGPLTGFLGSLVNVSAKSPLTLLRGESNMNGHFGTELVYSGYNAGLLITGKADRPVYIYIKDDLVEIRDASHLWGKMNMETQYVLKKEVRKELDDQNFVIASIGPAGEHLVRNSGISHDFYHHAARLGMGAVMGSKNLKAIAVRGTRPPKYSNPARLFELTTTFLHNNRLQKAQERRWGHSTSVSRRYYATTEGIKNKQLGWDAICDLSNPILHEQKYKVWNDGCSLCASGCKVPYMRRDPPVGPCVGELRHDNNGGWNANVMIPGFDVQLYLTPFVDNLGIDNEDISGVVAWAMECYEKGVLKKEDLDGIDLTWGNLPAICKLVQKIAYREGVGDVLADGLKVAAQRIGRGSDKYAMTCKGVAITSYELRGSIKDAVSMAVVPCGELHNPYPGRGSPPWVMLDSLTACQFLLFTTASDPDSFAKWAMDMLEASCGWQLTREDWDNLVGRVAAMERCYCLREGYNPETDDTLPARFFDEVIYNKYGEPRTLDRAKFAEWRAGWYLHFGLNKNGLPTKEYLEKLGLGFVTEALKERIGH